MIILDIIFSVTYVQRITALHSMDGRLLVEERIVNIGIPLDGFGLCCFNDFLNFVIFVFGFGSLQTSLLRIIGE